MARSAEDPNVRVRGNYDYVGSAPGRTLYATMINTSPAPYAVTGWNVVIGDAYTYAGFDLVATPRTRVVIDPNVRVRGNGTYAGFEDVTGPIALDEAVEVYEPESGLAGKGRVTDIDGQRELVYLSVDWSSLTEETPEQQAPAPYGRALYISAGQAASEHDWLDLSAEPSLAYVSLSGWALQVTAPARGWLGDTAAPWAISPHLEILQPYAELNTDRVVVV